MTDSKSPLPKPAPAKITFSAGGEKHTVSYEKAFSFACTLLEGNRIEEASTLFSRLEEFTDRGPRAFIMHAFCECAAQHFEASKSTLEAAFEGEPKDIAAKLHEAFVSYHVGIRQDGLKAVAELAEHYHNLPTLCLLLGNMLQSAGKTSVAKRCWSLAVRRDRPSGAVATAAMHQLRKADEGASASN